MKIKNEIKTTTNITKTSLEVLQSKVTSLGVFDFKKMITEVILILPLCLTLLFICWRFRHLIKIMADVGNIFNNDKFFGDVADTTKEGTEQHKKREELKSIINKGKLGHK